MPARRDLLRMAGAGAVLAPFWRLLSRPGHAGSLPTVRNLLILHSPNGTIHSHWRPTGSSTAFSFPKGSILEPLSHLREHLILCDGLDLYNAVNHEAGMEAMLTNLGSSSDETGGMSLDQLIAARLGGGYKFPSLELGVFTSVWGGSIQTRMSYAAPGSMLTPDDDPRSVYTRLYGDQIGDKEEIARRLQRRLSVLDLLGDEISTLEGRLGAEERVRLEAHLDALRGVENQLSSSGICDPSGTPERIDIYETSNFPTLTRLQLDLAVEALACGFTRVATVQLSHTVSPVVPTWLGLTDAHHTLSHAADDDTRGVSGFVAAERWFSEQFAYLLEQLMAQPAPDGDGTLLDATLVVWAKEMGDPRMHVCTDTPFILAGGGGAFVPGRYLDFGGQPHAHLLVSICHAFGLTNTTFGAAAAGSGPLEGL